MSAHPLDPRDPEAAIAAAAKRCSNWGRWGADDVQGTLNFLTDAKRREGAELIRRGASFSLAQSFDANGPQKGWRRRTNPVHTMLDTGVDAERGNQGFPHGLGGADDVIFMPLQASTQWDGLGHIFDHGNAWNGRRAGDVVTSEGDLVTGIQTATGRLSGRGVLLDVGRAIGENGELPDGFAITAEHGPMTWKTKFGASQQAAVKLATIDPTSPSQGVLLKVQAGSIATAGAISVVYDAPAKAVRVSTFRLGSLAWTPSRNKPVTFANGDVVGAGAMTNGEVQVTKNGATVATVTLNSADKWFFNPKGHSRDELTRMRG